MKKMSLKSLECPICYNYMLSEILLCATGHSICKKCVNTLKKRECPICAAVFPNIRNYALEDAAEQIKFPCRNESCNESLDSNKISEHEETCKFGLQKCPLYFNGCTWKGLNTRLKQHFEEEHSRNLNTWRLCVGNFYVYVINLEEIFLVFSKRIGQIESFSAMYTGFNMEASQYKLKLLFGDMTQQGYKMVTEMPCIQRCDIEKVFYSYKFDFHVTAMKPFLNINTEQLVVNPSII